MKIAKKKKVCKKSYNIKKVFFLFFPIFYLLSVLAFFSIKNHHVSKCSIVSSKELIIGILNTKIDNLPMVSI